MLKRVPFIDSHTGGEPTRLILDGGPDLGRGTLARRRELFRSRHDRFRSSVACEPRGSEISVGALLCEASRPDRAGGLIFFNNVDTLGMCGHGTIGAVASLAYLGRLRAGRHVFETPVGEVVTELHPDGRVSVANVASYRFRRQVRLGVDGYGTVEGDIAWGGNWFFIIPAPERLPLTAAHVDALTRFSLTVRASLSDRGVHGVDGAEIDHIELT
ncbi:MAG: proline racemase family protein, partial [Acidobacteriota bacterium]